MYNYENGIESILFEQEPILVRKGPFKYNELATFTDIKFVNDESQYIYNKKFQSSNQSQS